MATKNSEILPPSSSLDQPGTESRAEPLSAEGKAEVPPGHLCRLETQALAVRIDSDDVLFRIEDGADRLAVVHLTWRQETNPYNETVP